MRVFVWGILLFFALPLSAQTFEGTLLGGFNMAQLDGDDLVGFHKLGINAGGRVNAILSERWSVGLEILYSQQGSSASQDDPLSAVIDKVTLNYVEVPVLVFFDEWKFRLHTGVSYAQLMGFKYIESTGEDASDLQDFNGNSLFYMIGTTFFFNEQWGLDVRWSKAFTDLQAQDGARGMFNRNIGIRLAYKF